MDNRKLPDIAPCPSGCPGGHLWEDNGWHRVQCPHWRGAWRKTESSAVDVWNRRSDAEAERRGAMAAVKWLERVGAVAGRFTYSDLREAIERGEVLPKAQSDRRGRRHG